MYHALPGSVFKISLDLLCVTFTDYFVDEGYIVVPVLVDLDHFLSLPERSFDGSCRLFGRSTSDCRTGRGIS